MHTRTPARSLLSGSVILSLLAGLLAVVAAAPAEATDRISQLEGFNARAWTMTEPDANGVRYIGGDFTSFQPWETGRAARLATSDASVDATFPAVTGGVVNAVAPDGAGGVIIGGTFSTVDGQSRTRLARILADGTVDPNFAPAPNNTVMTIAVTGSTVLVGGLFGSVSGTTRSHLAALDLASGAVLDWNPSPDWWVLGIEVVGDLAYIGGRFDYLGAVPRTRLAAVRLDARTSPASGTCLTAFDATDCITSFAPTMSNDAVDDIAVSGSTLYAAGYFDITGTVGTRNHLAAMSTSTVADNAGLLAWSPQPDSQVRSLTIDGSRLYVGGDFSTIDGQSRGKAASFDISTPTAPTLTAWNPDAAFAGTYNNGRQISDIRISGSTAYVAGNFWSLGGEPRNRLGAVDTTTGAATSWDPHICDYSNGVSSTTAELAIISGQVIAGGDFDCAGGLQRRHAAAVGADGILTSWAPAVDGPVFAFGSNGSTIYMTGNFSRVTGTSGSGGARTKAAAVTTGGAVTSWAPTTNDRATAVLVSGSSVYLAGFFSTVGGTSRPYLAKVDATTGALDGAFNPSLDNAAEHISLLDGRLYLAGRFTTVGGTSRLNFAAVDATTGALDPWTVGTPTVTIPGETHGRGLYGEAIVASGDRVFIGGSFLGITPPGSGTTVVQRYVAAADAVTGELDLTWRPATVRGNNGNGDVYAISVADDAVYLGGQNDFSITDSAGTRNRLAAVDPVTGALQSWNAQAGAGEIRGLSHSTAAVFVAGIFDSLGGSPRYNTGAVATDGTLLAPWPLNPATVEPVSVTSQTASGSGATTGTVTSSPPGITCEQSGDACAFGYSVGQTVTFTAVPDTGASFLGWQGDCTGTASTCSVTISGTTSVQARFSDREGSTSDTGTGGTSSGSSSSGSSNTSSSAAPSAGSATSTSSAPSPAASTAASGSVSLRKGKRVRKGSVDRIRVVIASDDLVAGTILRPMVKLGPKSAAFRQGKARVVVRADGSGTWQRRVPASLRATVYFIVDGTDPAATSNRVSWKATRPATSGRR